MKFEHLHRLTAWLCLALVLLSGLTPAQGFVLCIEADGCVSVELKAPDAICGSCDGHESDAAPGSAAVDADDGFACPCIDVAVPGIPEGTLTRSRVADIHVGPWIAPPAEPCIAQAPPIVSAGRGPPIFVPRIAESWAHIRSVVLLV